MQPGPEARPYLFREVDLDHGGGAERRRASVPGLHHQRPLAVCLLGDVLHNLQGLDVRFHLDLTGVRVNVKDVIWVSLHDGVLNDIIRLFCVIVDRLKTHTYVQTHAYTHKSFSLRPYYIEDQSEYEGVHLSTN